MTKLFSRINLAYFLAGSASAYFADARSPGTIVSTGHTLSDLITMIIMGAVALILASWRPGATSAHLRAILFPVQMAFMLMKLFVLFCIIALINPWVFDGFDE